MKQKQLKTQANKNTNFTQNKKIYNSINNPDDNYYKHLMLSYVNSISSWKNDLEQAKTLTKTKYYLNGNLQN